MQDLLAQTAAWGAQTLGRASREREAPLLLHMLPAVKGAPRSHLANTTDGLAPMEGNSRCRFRAPFGRRQLVNGRRPIGPSGKFGHEKPLAALKSRRARQELPAWPANVRVIPLPSSPGGLIHTSAACFVHETGGGSREMGRHLCRCELPAGRPPMLRRETGEQVALAATNHARPAGASMRAKRSPLFRRPASPLLGLVPSWSRKFITMQVGGEQLGAKCNRLQRDQSIRTIRSAST